MASDTSLQVSSRLLNQFTRYHGYKVCLNERTNAADGQPENTIRSPTQSCGEGIETVTLIPICSHLEQIEEENRDWNKVHLVNRGKL